EKIGRKNKREKMKNSLENTGMEGGMCVSTEQLRPFPRQVFNCVLYLSWETRRLESRCSPCNQSWLWTWKPHVQHLGQLKLTLRDEGLKLLCLVVVDPYGAIGMVTVSATLQRQMNAAV
uniref:Uncharacterized protein n=1 Tax=Gopherus agassizii TaxID=38772 RepID=A0A452I7U0_9SAUR